MHFDNIIGQEEVKQRLLHEVETGRLPHALLLAGPEGNGGFAIAWALASRLLNNSPLVGKMQHPDLYFSYPIYKKDSSKPAPCDLFAKQWREMVMQNPYFDYSDWMNGIGAENQQLMIYVDEANALLRKFSLKSNQGGYKVAIIWLPERMNADCANKLLKLLEEPPTGSVFILVSEHPELLLTTIRSRCQNIEVPKFLDSDIEQVLITRHSIDPTMAHNIARSAYGNLSVALRQIVDNSEQEQFLELFKSLMRLSYTRKVREMKLWSEEVAGLGRERQKRFLNYCQRMIRENFVYNFGNPDLNYMNGDEAEFAVRFAPFINENNVIGIMDELQLCYRDIAQNGNAKFIFFDFALKMIVLIKNR